MAMRRSRIVFIACASALAIPGCGSPACPSGWRKGVPFFNVIDWCNTSGLCQMDGKTLVACTATDDSKNPCLSLEMPCPSKSMSLVIPLDPIRAYADLPDLYLVAEETLQVLFDGQPASCGSLVGGSTSVHYCKTIPGAGELEIVFLPCTAYGVESYEIKFWDRANPPEVCLE
jgi:hypothetical protein